MSEENKVHCSNPGQEPLWWWDRGNILRVFFNQGSVRKSSPHSVYSSFPKTLQRGLLRLFLHLPNLHSNSLSSLFLLFLFITLFYDETSCYLFMVYPSSGRRLLISQGLEQCSLNIEWIIRAASRGTFCSFSAYKNLKKWVLILRVKQLIRRTLPLPFICFVTPLIPIVVSCS